MCVLLFFSTWDKQEGVLYLLLEYGEMDLMTVIRRQRQTMTLFMNAVRYFWSQMLQIVKVSGVVRSCICPFRHLLCHESSSLKVVPMYLQKLGDHEQ